MFIEEVFKEVERGYEFSFREALEVVERCCLRDVLWLGDKLRDAFKGREVFTCSIINAKSGHCSQDCAFCAQSSYHRTSIRTYPLLSIDHMVREGIKREEEGATYYSFVTSGNMLSLREMEDICEAAARLRQRTNLRLCASLGQLDRERASLLKEAGFSRYHHNLETSESFFPSICTTHSYREDLHTLEVARSAGLEVCSGGIMGLGEEWSHRVELGCTLRDMEVESIPINFLNPIPGTRLESRGLLPPLDALKCIFLFRLLNPSKDITICGGREITLGDLQALVFFAGANGLMIGNYLTTQGRDVSMDMSLIRTLGLEVRGR